MPLSNPLVFPTENALLFFTATILNWKHLLKPDKYKYIIVSSMKHMHEKERMQIAGFVIMPNHFHMIFGIGEGHQLSDIQRDMLKYTGQQIKFDLIKHHFDVLEHFKSTQKDRAYQFWERRPLAVPLYTYEIIEQKLNYIHRNPINEKWKLAEKEEDYYYSSARFYLTGEDQFGFLKHYRDI